MSRPRGSWLGWAVLGALAVTALLGVMMVALPGTEPTDEEQSRAISAELRCPDCAGLSAADSPTQAASEIRRQVDEMLTAGFSPDEIKASFVARYGPWILLTPPGAAPWLVPLAAMALGTLVLAWWLLSPGRGRAQTPAGERGPEAGHATWKASLSRPTARRLAVGAAVALIALLGIGFVLPEPLSLAAETVVNQPLAEAQAAEASRQADIERLLAAFNADPTDTATLSDLADAYLAGNTAEDLQRGASALLLLIGLEPEDPDAYARLISAYIRASDWTDATAATDALADLAPDSPDVPFFRGLIAWRGYADAASAIAAFDAFLGMAPDDPRVPMIRGLRQQAAAEVD